MVLEGEGGANYVAVIVTLVSAGYAEAPNACHTNATKKAPVRQLIGIYFYNMSAFNSPSMLPLHGILCHLLPAR
jgi:hypothetical protein